MGLLRSALLSHPLLALAVGLSALMLRLAVPAGFMPVLHHGQLTLTICSDYGTAAEPGHRMLSADEAQPDRSCAFADLALPLVGAADEARLPAALLFVIGGTLFLGAMLPPRRELRLRPPLRGPPLPT